MRYGCTCHGCLRALIATSDLFVTPEGKALCHGCSYIYNILNGKVEFDVIEALRDHNNHPFLKLKAEEVEWSQ
jgi:hypothetical protein